MLPTYQWGPISMAAGAMTMSWPLVLLMLLMALGLTVCAVAALLVLLHLQTQWMQAFGETRGIAALNTGDEAGEASKPVSPPREKHRISVPLPGSDFVRRMRQ